ncbi:MAG: HD domain-containing protein [Anaerolineae bacterium]
MRLCYRVRQFLQALAAAPAPAALAELPPPLQVLYARMMPADRAHALRTAERLAQAGAVPPELYAAALLHDAGKAGRAIHLFDRVLFVLLARLAPALLQRIRTPGLVALREHAALGAADVACAGGSRVLVALIRHHHDDPAALAWPAAQRDLLRRLQQADDES